MVVLIFLKVEDSDVCAGAIGLEGPIIAQDLRKMTLGSHTSQLFCITFFGLCDFPAVTPYNVPFPSPKPATQRPAVSGKTPLKIVHFSDIHVDHEYEVGANTNCTKPICCRPYTSADAPGNNSYPAGEYGNYNCDAPVSLEESMYAAIKEVAPDATATLFTGDIVEGAVWLVNSTGNIADINDAYSRMSGLKNLFATTGNHESSPVNSFPPKAVGVTTNQWVYDTLSTNWIPFIGSTAASSADSFGAYSTLLPGGNLRVISINTNLYYKSNYWLYEATMETDPSGQLAWLVTELQAAETAGQRVYIIGHMPMGSNDALHDGSNYFNQITQRYSATIAALFFGKLFLNYYLLLANKIRSHSPRPISNHIQQLQLPNCSQRHRSILHHSLHDSHLRLSRLPRLLRRSRDIRYSWLHNLHRGLLSHFLHSISSNMETLLLC